MTIIECHWAEFTRSWIDFLIAQGIPIAEIEMQLGRVLSPKQGLLPSDDNAEFLRWCTLRLNRIHAGLILGKHVKSENLGIFGYLLRSFTSVEQARHAVSVFQSTVFEKQYISLESADNRVHLTFDTRTKDANGERSSIEFAFSAIVSVVPQIFRGERLALERIDFRHSDVESSAVCGKFFCFVVKKKKNIKKMLF
ncbi:MAG: AraC family transcriptional regulator ligand-binding domain-containing protein, partial [Pseudomonadota bacterium]